jgi:hypothetical protein
MQHDRFIPRVERDKARRVRSNDSIPLYSTFFRAYGLHTKVIYLWNSFRFDFKWSELTADPPTTRTVVRGGGREGGREEESERKRRDEKSSDAHRFPRGVEKRPDITRSMRRRVRNHVVSYRHALFTGRGRSVLPLLLFPASSYSF